MNQTLKDTLMEVLEGYFETRLYNLHYMYKNYCANEEEERLYIFGMRMQSQVEIIKEWLKSDEPTSDIGFKAFQHLVNEILDDFFHYLSDGLFIENFDIEQKRNIKILKKDFLNYPEELMKFYDRA